MNTRQIEPIQVWTPNGTKTITVLALSNFFDYHFDDGSGKVEYKLVSVNIELGATEHFVGIIEVPASVVHQWGTDDSIIWNYVSTTLNLTIIS